MRRLGRGVWLGLAVLSAVCAMRPSDWPSPASIAGVPHIRQEPDFCGEACVAMALRKLGYDVNQRAVFYCTGLDPRLGRGAYTAELKRAIDAFGFRSGPVWFKVRAANAAADLERHLQALYADIARGVPSIVCIHHDPARARPSISPGARLRPRDQRNHLPRAGPGPGRLQAHAGRALPRAVAARIRPGPPGRSSALRWNRDRWTSASAVHLPVA